MVSHGRVAVPVRVHDDERALLERAARGEREARRRLIESHLGLVAAIARRYARRWGVPFEDLLQEGALALVQAVDHYDPSRGMKLSTYANWWVSRAVRRAAMAYVRPVRVPEEVWERAGRVSRAEEEVRSRLGHEAGERAVASALGWTAEELSEVRRALEPVASLEAPVGEEGDGELADVLPGEAEDPAEEAARSDARRRLAEALAALPERERRVLSLRNGFEGESATLAEAGRELGVSRERARQIEGSALERLRRRSREFGLEGLAA